MPIENILTAGGIVSYLLIAFSLIAVALIVERIIFWLRIKRRQRRIVKEILSIYRSDPFSAIAKQFNWRN
jgi:biopolymer transport protein ExbB